MVSERLQRGLKLFSEVFVQTPSKPSRGPEGSETQHASISSKHVSFRFFSLIHLVESL